MPMAQSSLGSPGLLSAGARAAGDIATDRSFARDLNLDQIVAAIAGDREERELITRVLFAPLHDADAVRYRREVFHDLENPALFGEVQRFSGLIGEVRAHLRQSAKMQDRYQWEGADRLPRPAGLPGRLHPVPASRTPARRAPRVQAGRERPASDQLRGRPVLPARRSAR